MEEKVKEKGIEKICIRSNKTRTIHLKSEHYKLITNISLKYPVLAQQFVTAHLRAWHTVTQQ